MVTVRQYLKYPYTWLLYKLDKLCIKDFNIFFSVIAKAGVSSL